MATTAPKVNGRTPRVLAASSEPMTHGLMGALLALAAQAPKLSRNADGQIGGRTYRYVDLDNLLDAIVPLLVAHELVWSARPCCTEGGAPGLRYTLTHVPSGESIEDVMPLLGAQDSQGVGSALTYARRYAMLAVLNLAPGDDDDGAAASLQNRASPPVDKYAEAAAIHAGIQESRNPGIQPVAAEPKPTERQLSDAQQRLVRVRAKDLSAPQLAAVLAIAKGEPVRRWDDEAAAKRWVDREVDRLPARLVDAVLEGIKACPPF